jgi:uncharacterized membrane protein YcaP (DUF421 family)
MTNAWWEPVIRVAIVYLFLLVLMRLSGKREMGQIAPMDLLTMLLVSETVSPALTAGDNSVTTAMIASGTLLVLTVALATATYASRRFKRVVEGRPRPLVRDGVLDTTTLRSERITDQELGTALRKAQLRGIDEVESAVVETDGQMTFIPKK